MSGLRNVHEVIILNYVELLILWQNVNANQVPSVLITLEVVRGVGGGGGSRHGRGNCNPG